ncbi:anti-sigma factor family protein [Streptomyces sp. NRRL WC-3549]|uniref:anti-sigma factor family protein n=1 Tax=Streptomyces sp. NRRL WC-3549 TaxID=1463925 RepID=UPI0004C60D4D|nr:zf-HC2 domain-containing protein [Streptomyces sp. NRRL WC-3549]
MSLTGPTPAEQHLGDRLAALVDGELKHDARERVLAHLATCSRCKAEADAQRRLKSAFATATPPPPSEGFLARLQGLPGGPGKDGDGPGEPLGGRRFGEGVFPAPHPVRGRARSVRGPSSPLDGFGYLPTVHGSTAVLPGGPGRSGFPVHEVGRAADRSPWRGRRFAFAAASAVSLAAIALGGTLPLEYGSDAPLSAEGAGSSATPLDADVRTAGAASAASRGGGSALAFGDRTGRAPTTAPVPAPAVSPPARPVLAAAPSLLLGTTGLGGRSPAFPVLNVSVPPLIRPTDAPPLLSAPPGGAADPEATPSATASAPPRTDHALPLSSLR